MSAASFQKLNHPTTPPPKVERFPAESNDKKIIALIIPKVATLRKH